MAVAFLLDEHLRGLLWTAIQRHNSGSNELIDAVCVGDPLDLPLGSTDDEILRWAESNDRVIITRDLRTFANHFQQHLKSGRHSPGVLLLRRRFSISTIVAALWLIANAGEPSDFADQVLYVP